MADGAPPPTSGELTEALQLLHARLNKIRRLAKKITCGTAEAEVEWDGIVGDLTVLRERLGPTVVTPDVVRLFGGRRLRARDAGEARRVLEATAYAGVAALAIEWHGTDWARVRIGTHAPLTLASSLANLLAVLAGDAPSADHLVGWKTLDDIAARLRELEGRPVSRRAVISRIWRLRKVFRAAKINEYYVLVRRHVGVRFALRRQDAPEKATP